MVGTAKRSGAGGAANELGSLHRSGVAAVLAVHGLTGSPLDGVGGRVPVSIALETDDPVDDIVTTMHSGAQWFIQAKRSARGKALDAALEQWARQDLGAADRVVVAVRRAGGGLQLAGEAMSLRENDSQAILSPKQTKALADFHSRLSAVAGTRTDELLAAARVMSINAEAVGQGDANAAAARLEGTIVRAESGPAAFAALQSFFWSAASKRVTTRAQDWVRAITDAGIDVLEDPDGAPGAVAASRATALREYRRTAANNLDVLSLHAICPEVPTLHVPDFLQSIQVRRDAEDDQGAVAKLTTVLVRNRRFVIRGLPGAGKSEGMVQTAAWLANDPAAPLPLLVRLGELAALVATAADLTVDTLIGVAARAQGRETAQLRAALSDAVASGHCLLLLDGLDEAHDKRGLLIEGLKRLLGESHPDLGLVLTTRASAEDVLHRLALPVTTLQPMRTSTTPIALLREFAAMLPDASREAWLETRTATYREQSEGHQDIWSVPLLATLATVRIARGRMTASSAAELLQAVVEDSIGNWHERRRRGQTKAPPSYFDPGMLIHGFAAVGRLLNTRTGVSQADALRAVETAVIEWGVPSPATAGVAQYIADFWDNGVGIFVEVDGTMKARSRQFAELGDAIHALRLDSVEERLAWLSASLSNPGQMNAVSLAASSSIDAARWLVQAAHHDADPQRRTRAASWVSQFAVEWTHRDEALMSALIDMLRSAVTDELAYLPPGHDSKGIGGILARGASRRDAEDGPGWHYAVSLAALRVPTSLDAVLDDALAACRVPDARRTLLLGTRALTAAAHDEILTDETVGIVERALEYPIHPDEESNFERDRFGTFIISGDSYSLPYGMSELGLAAAGFAPQLSAKAIDVLWRIARKTNMTTSRAIERRLTDAGQVDPNPVSLPGLDLSGFSGLSETLSARWLLEPLSERYPADAPQSADEAWRLTSLAQVFDSIGLGEASVPDIRAADAVGPELVGGFVDCLVTAGGIDGAIAATQARQLLTRDDFEDLLQVLYSSQFTEVDMDAARLSEDQLAALLRVVADATPWMSFAAFRLLYKRDDPALADAARATDGQYWRNERHLGWLRVSRTADPQAEVALMLNESSAYRAAAALFVRDEDEPWKQDAVRLLVADDDATVRGEAGGTLEQVEAAKHWTCVWCGQEMDTGIYVCTNCSLTSINSIAVHEQLRNPPRRRSVSTGRLSSTS